MLSNNAFKVGLEFQLKCFCGKTGRLKGTSGRFFNRLISSIKTNMFVGVDPLTLQVGDNDADPIPNDVNVRSPIPLTAAYSQINGSLTQTLTNTDRIVYRQNTVQVFGVVLPVGEVRYVKEIGIPNFNRALVKSLSGKKYGLHVENGDLIEISMTATLDISIVNPNVPITLLDNGQFVATVNARQEFYTQAYSNNNPSFTLPNNHSVYNYNWYDLLKGKSGIWLKPEINTSVNNWYLPDVTNKVYDVISDKNLFGCSFLTPANTPIKQIVGYIGIANALLILTFDGYLTLPKVVTAINLEMKLTGDL